MNTAEIKQYVQDRLARMEDVPSFDRGSGWHEEARLLRELWLQAEQVETLDAQVRVCRDTNDLLKRIARSLEALASDKQP